MAKDILLSEAYSRAGNDFLASDLECMFRILKTPEDIARHNVMVEKVFKMVGQDTQDVNRFYRAVAHKILRSRAKKSFVRILADVLIGEREGL